MPQRRSSFIQYPCLHFDPFTLWVAAHIARHYSDLWIIPYPFHLACVSERIYVQRAVFFGKPYRSSHGLACFPVGFHVEVFLVCKFGEAIGAHSGVFSTIERVRRTYALRPKRLTPIRLPNRFVKHCRTLPSTTLPPAAAHPSKQPAF
jgi:hypothetical protein